MTENEVYEDVASEIREELANTILYGPSEEMIADGQVKARMNGYLGWKMYDPYRSGGEYSKENHPVSKRLLYEAWINNQYTPQEAARLSGYDPKESEVK